MTLKSLQKYPQTFFTNFNNKAKLKRFRHRLVAWYILNRIGIDSETGIYFFLKYLARHSDIKKTLNSTFYDYKDIVEKKYQIKIDTQSNILKDEMLYGCKICKNCAKRSKSKFCSVECSNKYHANDKTTKEKISIGLLKYYSNVDSVDIKAKHEKIRNSIISAYSGMTVEEKRLRCKNKILRYTSYDDFSLRFPALSLSCSKQFYYNNTEIPIICECGNKFISHKGTSFYPLCRVCNPIMKHKTQNEIYEYVKSLYNGTVKSDDRNIIKPLEIDIVFNKTGIEFNGILSHSFGKTEKLAWANNWNSRDCNIHLRKTEMCEEKDIHLFHINEYEWGNTNKQKIWKSMIKNSVGLNNIIYARKTTIKLISSKESNDFILHNHIQGIKNAKIKIGLFYENELVQVMTLGTPTQQKYKGENHYELVRLCSLLNTTVIGGASKLLKYFERTFKPKMIISYANRRWAYSKSTVYNKLGFEYKGNSKPNFVVCRINDRNVYSRQVFQKHKLINILKYYDDNKTAIDNIVDNGYRIFYDSGNLIYVKKYI
jgi:hypothetical protein